MTQMETESPMIAFVKALARRQARLDAAPPPPANENSHEEMQAKKQ